MDSVNLRAFTAEDKDWLVRQHGVQYAHDEGFDDSFGSLVDSILTAFLAEHDPDVEAGWIAQEDGNRLGSIFCVRVSESTAKLRVFLLVPEARGKGLGQRMLDRCMGFARSSGYKDMVLWTHESHKAACALYAKTGWTCTSSTPVRSFGVDLVEQSWHIDL